MNILLTGGCGFIGSHTAIELLKNGHTVIIVDNLSNSKIDVIKKISQITKCSNRLIFHQGNIRDDIFMNKVFKIYSIECIIHFAAYKSVGESITNPLKYYNNNIIGLLHLLDMTIKYKIKSFIFSSSATVYGNFISLPLTEESNTNPINPYGQTKLMCEQILKDVSQAHNLNVAILRYFNPVGGHESGLIGEDPLNKPSNLFPYIIRVVEGYYDSLNIFGNDYNTPDGTGIRDYIHVVDLALGHVSAINYLNNMGGFKIYNLGTGKGYSVLEVVKMFNNILKETGDKRRIKYNFVSRREGDLSEVYSDCTLAKKELDWSSVRDLKQMVLDSLNFVNINSKKT